MGRTVVVIFVWFGLMALPCRAIPLDVFEGMSDEQRSLYLMGLFEGPDYLQNTAEMKKGIDPLAYFRKCMAQPGFLARYRAFMLASARELTGEGKTMDPAVFFSLWTRVYATVNKCWTDPGTETK